MVVGLAGVCTGGEQRRRAASDGGGGRRRTPAACGGQFVRAVKGGRWAIEGGSSRQQGWAEATRGPPPFPADKTHMVSNLFFDFSIVC